MNNDFRLPSVATVSKKVPWFTDGTQIMILAKLIPGNSFPALIHTLSISATFVPLSHFILHRPLTLRKLKCWEATAILMLSPLLPHRENLPSKGLFKSRGHAMSQSHLDKVWKLSQVE